jgi:hypothetical protein
VTDFTELDDRARDAAARLRESVDDAIPSLERAIRRSGQRRARGITVMAAVLICTAAGVGVGTSMLRTGSEQPAPGAPQLQGAWSLPKATADVSTEPRPSVSSGSTKTVGPRKPLARIVTGPWTAVVHGNRLTLREPETNTAIVQRIEFPEPGRFSVVEADSGGTATFGCTNVGEYSFDRAADGAVHVQAVADACEPRVEVLIAGAWSGFGPESTSDLPTEDPTASPSISEEPSPTSSVFDVGTPSAEEPTPPELQNTPDLQSTP